MAETGKRLDWVDMAKGLSIFLVVMMYAASSVGEDTGGVGVLHWAIAFATPFRMPEFFLISGLFLSQVIDRPWRTYADRRVVHYLYFYALWARHPHHLQGRPAGRQSGRRPRADSPGPSSQPYGVLWFIYMLAVVSAATKLLHEPARTGLGRVRRRRDPADGVDPHRQLPDRPVRRAISSSSTPATSLRRSCSAWPTGLPITSPLPWLGLAHHGP